MDRMAMSLLVALFVSAVLPAQSGGGPMDAPDPPWLPAGYYPPWESVTPVRTIPFVHNPQQTPAQNGAALAAAILALKPGEMLSIGPGAYSLTSKLDVVLQGTATAPIRVWR